jgi:hypothetical protein
MPGEETTACLEATEARLESKELTSVEGEAVSEHREVPKQEVSVEMLEHCRSHMETAI